MKQSVEFKKLCIESTLNFKKTSNEHFEWFNNCRSLKVANSIDKIPETREICHQSPFVSDERFKDYEAEQVINNELMQNGNETVEDIVQFSQIDDTKQPDKNDSHLNYIDKLTDEQFKEITAEISDLIQLCILQKESNRPPSFTNLETSTLLNGKKNNNNRSRRKRRFAVKRKRKLLKVNLDASTNQVNE